MSETIMIIDDEPAFRYATRLYFEDKGFAMTEAEDGVAALRMFDSEPLPDLIILDINMPRISGIDVLRYLQGRQDTQFIPVVMLTARGDAESETLSWLTGCDWYHLKSKPIQYEDLLLAIQRILAAKQADNAA